MRLALEASWREMMMQPRDRAEFLNELEATDENYVRRKLLLGYYTGWQLNAVEHWLDLQRGKREETRAKRNLFWVAATCVMGSVGVAATLVVK